MADAGDPDALLRRCKAINTLFPYAVRQERDKTYPILDVFLHAVKITPPFQFWWHHVLPFMDRLFNGTSHISSKRALVLASPYVPWGRWDFGEDRARIWAVAASAVPKDEDIAPSIINTLFQIAYCELLPPHLYSDAWSWLILRPSLPAVCKGREVGSIPRVLQTVQDLKDVEILKSYLLLIWSEWGSLYPGGHNMMEISIREDFSGIEMNSHRADLLQRLDHVLAQLDTGLERLQKYRPDLNEVDLQERKNQYGALREILLDVDQEALGPDRPPFSSC